MRALPLCALLMAGGVGAHAAALTWDGPLTGSASWGDAANWSGDTLPGVGDTAQFTTGTATVAVSLDASREVASLFFSSANTGYIVGTAADATAGFGLTVGHVKRDTATGSLQTIRANVALSQTQSIWEINTGFNNGVMVSGVISGSGKVVNKWGGGTLTLAAANTFDGGLSVNAGTLSLDFNQGTSPTTNIVAVTNTLTIGQGATVSLTGKGGNSVSQTFAGTSLQAGGSAFTIANGSTANTRTLLNLGAITRETGALLNFTQPTGTGNTTVGATNGFTTTTLNDASGILGAYATVGSDYATNNGTNIVAFTGYSDLAGAGPVLADSSTTNVRVTSGSTGDVGQGAGVTTVNTIRVNDATARTITVGTGNTLRLGAVGGILATGTSGLTIGGSGNAGTLTAGGADDTAGELIVNNSTAVTVNSVVANNGTGAVTFVKTGAGTTTLTEIATHTGGTVVNGGTLQLAAGTDRLPAAGKVTVSGGTLNLGGSTQNLSGTLIVSGGALSSSSVVTGGGTIANGTINKTGSDIDARGGTISAVITGSAGISKTTPGALALSNTTANTFTGTTVITEGAVRGGVGGDVVSISGNLVVGSESGGNAASYTNSGSNRGISANSNITVFSNGTVSLGSGAQALNSGSIITIVGGTFDAGTQFFFNTGGGTNVIMTGGVFKGTVFGNTSSKNFQVNASANTATMSGNVQRNVSFNVADGAAATDLAVTGVVNGSTITMTKSGAGMMVSSGNSGYTGATNLSGGTLSVTTLANGASNSAIGASTSAAANLLLGNGTTFQYTGSGHSTDRLFTVNGSSAGHAATIEASGTGAVNFTNTGSLAWGTTAQTRTLKLGGTSTADNTLAVLLANNGSGAVSVTKQDAGKWILTGANTYTGATTINAGSLIVNGSLAASSAVAVNTGGTLGGSGTIGGVVTVASGGFLAPGNSPGVLTVGSLTLSTGSTTALEIAGATTRGTDYDGVTVSTASGLTYGGTLSLAFASTLTNGDSLDLFSFTGVSTGDFTSVVSTGTYAGSWASGSGVWTFTSNDQLLTFNLASGDLSAVASTVPEPSSFALIGGAIALSFACGRRRRA